MRIKKTSRILIYFFIFSLFLLAGFLFSNSTGNAIKSEIKYANLTRVIDGDTIETDLGKIRLLGINTPEKNQKNYEDAKYFLKQFEGKEIALEKLEEDKDMYGRYLRYVFYDDRFLNKELLGFGFAHYYSYNEDKYSDELRKAEEKARENELGIWEISDDKCKDCIFLKELNEIDPGEYLILENGCSFLCDLNDWTIDDDSSSHTRKLNFELEINEIKKINYNGSIWNDDGDRFYLRDDEGYLVLFYEY